MSCRLFICVFVFVCAHAEEPSGKNSDKNEAMMFLLDFEGQSRIYCNKANVASWNYYTDLTDENQVKMLEANEERSKFMTKATKTAATFAWEDFEDDDPDVYKWFKTIVSNTDRGLPKDKNDKLMKIKADMSAMYGKAKVCNGSLTCDNPTLSPDPDLVLIMGKSENYEELERVWVGWRDATGKKLRPSFLQYVELRNEWSKANGYEDTGDEWRQEYGPNFQVAVEKLWTQIRPFYLQLHAYARRKLSAKYPGKIKPDGPIPAHILGDLFASTWFPKYKIFEPFANGTSMNVTHAMIDKQFTPLKMFKTAEEFYTSLGLNPMTPEFWENSIIEKPKDRENGCLATAWDFCNDHDFRINMCTKVMMEDLLIIHHEMGHIEYYMHYSHLPEVYRNGANPGFHEAIGDAIALSVSTPTHMKEIGLLDELIDSRESEINFLMQIALDKIAFLPFGYLMDEWRWGIFNGSTTDSDLNRKWWEAKLKYQGVCPPVQRTEEDLDAASLFHIIEDVSYIRYFVSFVIQFQFHRALCKEAGHQGPLHKCDIYRSKAAGALLSDVLSKGSSVSWNEAMSILTKGETDQMDASGILEYFQLLIEWLEKQNAGNTIGWTSDDPTLCPSI